MKYFQFLKRNFKTGLTLLDVRYFCDKKLNFKRILVLNKRTRYELEKVLRPDIKDDELEKIIRKRGSDFDRLILHHNLHRDFLNEIVKQFSKFDTHVEVVNRINYGRKEVDWADLIVVAGGDGTFLLGANQILNHEKPIVGFNTDPQRSEGYLCLPKKYTFDIPAAVHKIMKYEFSWLMRNRIEVQLEGVQALDEVVVLDSTKIKRLLPCPSIVLRVASIPNHPSFSGLLDGQSREMWDVWGTDWPSHDRGATSTPTSVPDCAGSRKIDPEIKKRVLPSLALNEVFMGETISSQVSHLLVKPDNLPLTSVKCSGLCVSTGTGSTSWHMSINRLTEDKVKKLLELAGQPLENVKSLTDSYNNALQFSPDEMLLGWSLREPIYGSVFPDPPGFPASGLTSEISVTSRCFSGFLVIDGTHCYPFHDGTKAHLYSGKEKRLRTMQLD